MHALIRIRAGGLVYLCGILAVPLALVACGDRPTADDDSPYRARAKADAPAGGCDTVLVTNEDGESEAEVEVRSDQTLMVQLRGGEDYPPGNWLLSSESRSLPAADELQVFVLSLEREALGRVEKLRFSKVALEAGDVDGAESDDDADRGEERFAVNIVASRFRDRPETVVVDESMDGDTIEVALGQRIEIQLQAAGGLWHRDDDSSLEPTDAYLLATFEPGPLAVGNAHRAMFEYRRLPRRGDDDGCICAGIDEPVCGADGYEYENACRADCANTPIADPELCEDRTFTLEVHVTGSIEPPSCQPLVCALYCPRGGLDSDADGCPVCRCKDAD